MPRLATTSLAAITFAALASITSAGQPDLTITPTCPTGGPAIISWSGASPSGEMVLIFSRDLGSVHIPGGGPCAGTTLGVGYNLLQIVFHGYSGPSGARTLNATIGAGACGRYLQFLDLTTCEPSNVALFQ